MFVIPVLFSQLPFCRGFAKCLFAKPPPHTLPLDYGYSYAVSGVKLESSRYIAAGRILLSRPVRARAALLRTHFLFEVNHVEVYNNIKFPFTRFVGSALFLRQKTHSPTPDGGVVYLFIISRITSTAMFFCTECVWFRFFSFSFLVCLIISTIPLAPPPPIGLNDSSSGVVGAMVYYLCCVCPIYMVAATLGKSHTTHLQSHSHSICVYIAKALSTTSVVSVFHRGTSFKTHPGV